MYIYIKLKRRIALADGAVRKPTKIYHKMLKHTKITPAKNNPNVFGSVIRIEHMDYKFGIVEKAGGDLRNEALSKTTTHTLDGA